MSNTSNVSIELAAKMIQAFSNAIFAETSSPDSEVAAEKMDEAWTLALECGYDWREDGNFKEWLYGTDSPSKLEMLIGGLHRTMYYACETSLDV
jgi:hypothetical protein